MATTIVQDRYRLPMFAAPDPLYSRCLQIATAVGLLALAVGLLVPKHTVEITNVSQVPERFAKLILEDPETPPPTVKLPEPPKVVVQQPVPKPPEVKKPELVVQTPPKTIPKTVGQRRIQKPKVDPDRGKAGRERAVKEVTQQLASVSGSLDQVLGELSASLASNDTGTKTRKPRRRKTRGGRKASDVGGVTAAVPLMNAPDASASSLDGVRIAITSNDKLESWIPDGSDKSTPGSGSSTRQDLRTDASLLSVVRKYAPGIRFCYDNELEKTPGLGGKLIVSITVSASGQVTGAVIARDTVGSTALKSCALAQIETWRFPRIPEGVVTFQAPFIFTPPE